MTQWMNDPMGFLDSAEREPLVAIINAYFDESGKQADHPVVSFTGVCVNRQNLATFDAEWEKLLRMYQLPSLHMKVASRLSRKVGSKMPAKQSAKDRIDALKPFADCINNHLEFGLVQAWDVVGFNNLDPAMKKGLGSPDDPYYLGKLCTSRHVPLLTE